MGIPEDHRFHPAGIDGSHMDSAGVQQPGAKGQPLGGIVVAADQQGGQPPPGQLLQEVVQKGHRLHRRDGFVIEIPRQEQGIGVVRIY